MMAGQGHSTDWFERTVAPLTRAPAWKVGTIKNERCHSKSCGKSWRQNQEEGTTSRGNLTSGGQCCLHGSLDHISNGIVEPALNHSPSTLKLSLLCERQHCRTMSAKLSSLPPEVLSLITDLIKSKQAIRLLLTGDLPLRMRLNAGGVSELDLFLPSPSLSKNEPLTAPNNRLCLHWCSHLSSLTVISKGAVLWDLQSLALPPTLRSVHFRFAHDCSVFLNLLATNLYPLPHLESLSLSGAKYCSLQPLQDLPKLRILRIGFYEGLSVLRLHHLPRNLLELQVKFTELENSFTNEKIGFPSSLTRLELTYDFLTVLLAGLLPSGLVRVELTPSKALPSYFGMLPPLPDTVTNLTVPHVQTGLPPFLTRLETRSTGRLQDDAWGQLPRTLTSTNIRFEALNDSNVNLLPPLLNEIDCLDIPSHLICKLPPTLTRLRTESVIGPLPLALKELRVTKFDIACIQYLPSSLTRLAAHGLELGSDKNNSPFWSSLSSKTPDLRYLEFSPRAINDYDVLAHLPRLSGHGFWDHHPWAPSLDGSSPHPASNADTPRLLGLHTH